MNHSYESLHSHQGQHGEGAAGQQTDFSWSRTRYNTGTEAPKRAFGCWDQPLCGTSRLKLPATPKPAHVPHDEYLQDIPGMHFSLMSLQEAALKQQLRRDRGDEDHTEVGRAFSDRVRSNTFVPYGAPIVPPSPRRPFQPTGTHRGLDPPAPIYQQSRLREGRTLSTRMLGRTLIL